MPAEDGAAQVIYGPASFELVQPGDHVTCAVTGRRIPLEELRYWSVERQEPYVTPEAGLSAFERSMHSRHREAS